MDQYFQAALRLHAYMTARYWDGRALVGPDVGIRFNSRIGRFVKAYVPVIPWRDSLYYVQGQGYWVLDNWELYRRTENPTYREIATQASDTLLARQREDGAWDYPNPEWKGRVATVEGTWGSLGLLESYRQTGDPRFLSGAQRWHDYLHGTIGFQQIGDEIAANYFANRAGGRVPNISAFVLRFLAELADLTGDSGYLAPCAGLLTFMRNAQKPSGEFPYAVPGLDGDGARPHFQCYQYNAFEALDLIRYAQLTGDDAAWPVITGVLDFLRGGIADDGHALYECGNWSRAVVYHTAAVGAALWKADQLGLDGYRAPANRAYTHLLGLQRPDGGFPHSTREYLILADHRSYPRNLAMILWFLLDVSKRAEPAGATEHRRSANPAGARPAVSPGVSAPADLSDAGQA